MIHLSQPGETHGPGLAPHRRESVRRAPRVTPPQDRADPALVLRAMAGEGHAVETLVGRYRAMVLRIALRYVRDPDDAEDLCQETLAAAVARLGECRRPEAFAGWLKAIARNRALTLLRRRAARRQVPLQAVGDLPSPDDPAREVEDGELAARLDAAIRTLPALQRRVLVLCDVVGLRHAEVARTVGISEGASRVHLHNARRRLRARLGDAESPGRAA